MNKELINRFLILSSDSEVAVKIEASFQLQYLIPKMDKGIITKNIFKLIDIYFLENDSRLKCSLMMTYIKNINIIKDVADKFFITNLVGKQIKLQKEEENKTNFAIYKDLIDCLLMECTKDISNSKIFIDFFKIYIKVI